MMDKYKEYLKSVTPAKLDVTRKEYKKNSKKPEEGNYYSYWATLVEALAIHRVKYKNAAVRIYWSTDIFLFYCKQTNNRNFYF